MGKRSARASPWIQRLLALALPLAVSACAIPTRVASVDLAIPRDATPVAIDAGLRSIDDPVNKRRIEQMLASPEMKAVEKELIAGIVDGSLNALSDQDRADRIGALTARYATGMLHGMTKDLAPELGPAVSNAARGAVHGVVSEALSPENRSAMGLAMTDGLTRDVGPAIEKVLADDLGPGLAAALEKEEVRRALGDTARLLGKEMVLGVNEGMLEAQKGRSESGDSSVLGSVGNLANKGAKLASGATWVLAALVLVLGGWLVKLLMQARKYRSESEHERATTRLISEARRASEGKPWSNELLSALDERLREQELGAVHPPSRRRGSDQSHHA